ncbi:MAG: calcium/sodium antiporter [Oscillospiraceae bacterium]|mgnify:CR=1 FL=1|nr:calcium/sodium antiporter [Oscillospiraceae bacterium]
MDTVITVALFALGLLLIIKGGDWFVDAAVWIANATGIPKFIIGATVVSLATTLPELTVSVTGVIDGELDMAVGNAIGSVTANIGLIMGISLVCLPAVIKRSQFWPKAVLMVAASALLWLTCSGGELTLTEGLLLLVIFALFIYDNIRSAKQNISSEERESVDKKALPKMLLLFVLGIAAIVVGSQLLIDYGCKIAVLLGVPSAIIGVTMVAIGTSLPELVTTITAIAKKESSMSIGNIIGANVIDLTLILPICSMVAGGGLKIAEQSYALDMPVCLGVGLLAILPPLITGKLHRWQGVLLLLCYAAYVAVLVTQYGV